MIEENTNRSCATGVNYICREFTDIDKQAKSLSGYDQKYQQLSCGRFKGWSKKLLFGKEFGFHLEVLNQILDQAASVPGDRYLVIFLMNRQGCCKINGRTFLSNHLLIARPGSSLTGIAGPGTHSAVISINKATFESMLQNNYPETREGINLPESGFFESDHTTAETLRKIIQLAENRWRSHPAVFLGSQTRLNLFQSLSDLISEKIILSLNSSSKNSEVDLSRRYNIVQNACDYINEHSEENISIVDLCLETGVSRRTLEYSFKDCIGESPISYLRKIKLNSIRRALLLSENTNKSIGDIAAEWGIWHLSRFAQYYRNQFHELPSETRKKFRS